LYAKQYGFEATIARLFAFVGPRLPMNAGYAVGNFIRDIMAGDSIQILGDGTPYRSYLYAADLAVWLWTILMRGESGRPYNVGSDEAISIADLARVVVEATGSNSKIEIARTPVPGAAAARYVPCVERARTELGLRPIVSLTEGIRRSQEWVANTTMSVGK
jgi:dTDP-glucose 4,6-dehydratase